MHQPIFASNTGFLKPFSDGRRFVLGSDEPTLDGGAKIAMLDSPMNLVRVTTDIGVSIDVTPETFFSFTIKDGTVLLYVPPEQSLATVKPLDWRAKWSGASDPRRWFIIGAIHADGAFSRETNRPARFIARKDVADDVEEFLRRVSINPEFRIESFKGFHAVNRVDLDARTGIVTSRVIDKLIGGTLTGGSKNLLFSVDELPLEARHAFLSGVLSGMAEKEGNLVFTSRYAAIVRNIHRIFMETAGLFSTLSINPMEPEVQKSTRVTYPHHCYLDDEAIKAAKYLGLLPSTDRMSTTFGFRSVKILEATPIGKHAACTIVAKPDYRTVANWFVSKASFTLPEAAEIASLPIVVNPANFEEVFK